MRFVLLLIVAGLFNQSCNQVNQNADAKQQEDSSIMQAIPAAEVKAMVVKKGDFDNEIVSNGKLTAAEQANLYFNLKEEIKKIKVNNGQFVKKRDTIAVLENFSLSNKVEQTRLMYEKSKLAFYDLLIGQGYDYNNTADIPEDILKKAQIKSGYASAKNDLELTNFQYNESFLIAPLSGVIANLYDKENNYPTSNKPFCSILDNRTFEIVFQVMESEITLIKPGEKVAIYPYHNESIKLNGHVKEINPVIDKNGLVNLTAVVNNSKNALYEGMNVKVFLQLPVKNKIVIPKEAVTIRSDKPVVFTYKKDIQNDIGNAQWVYVTTGTENNNSIIIEDGIDDGDTVIYKGNIHLAHGSEVVIVE